MGRRIIGALACAVGVLVIAVLTMGPAGAGGGTYLRGDRESYEVGEVVHLSADVYKLDRDWYGPYTVMLRSFGGTVPGAETGIPVGRLVVTRLDEQFVRAEVTFVLPKLPNGSWMVDVHSSRPLGDLSSGFLTIGPVPPPPSYPPTTVTPATVVAAPPIAPTTRVPVTTTAPPTTAPPTSEARPADELATAPPAVAGGESTTGSDPAPWWIVGAIAVVALVAAAVVISRRRGPRRIVTGTSSSGGGDHGSESVVDVALAPADDEPVPTGSAGPTIGVGR